MPAQSLVLAERRQVYGSFERVAVGGPLFPGVGIAVSDYGARLFGYEVGVVVGDVDDAVAHGFGGERFGLERDGAVQYIFVVDGRNGVGIVWGNLAYHRIVSFLGHEYTNKRPTVVYVWGLFP